MQPLTEYTVTCPYCGEAIDVLIDGSEPLQDYIEDCQVCCRPIVFHVSVAASGDVSVAVYSEDETF